MMYDLYLSVLAEFFLARYRQWNHIYAAQCSVCRCSNRSHYVRSTRALESKRKRRRKTETDI